MKERSSFGDRLRIFLDGKGFYIVLILCLTVIGVSAWVMLTGVGTDVENMGSLTEVGEEPYLADAPNVMPELPDIIGSDSVQDAVIPELPVIEPEVPVLVEEGTNVAPSQPVTNLAPVFIGPVIGEIEVPYCMESLRYDVTMADWRVHNGIDIASPLGTQVMAVSSGIVENVYEDDAYGTTVIIDHGAGLKSIYANLAEKPTVYKNDSIAVGEIIGSVGMSALCEIGTVYHLHFAMTLDGEYVNPAEYLPAG